MKCILCEKFYKDYPLKLNQEGEMLHHLWQRGKAGGWSSPIQCAFDNPKQIFDAENNWSCKTMIGLRRIADKYGYYHRDDDIGTIGVVPINAMITDSQMGFIVMTWYKERGHTGKAYVVNDNNEIEILTFTTAEAVIKYYTKEAK